MEGDRPDGGTANLSCEFCRIVARQIPARVLFEDDELIVFHNRLTWAPVMLLVAPKRHVDQEAFWGSPLLARAAELALGIGRRECPQGFRILSNFGQDALQTQEHGHLHVVGGRELGFYMDPRGPGQGSSRWYPSNPP